MNFQGRGLLFSLLIHGLFISSVIGIAHTSTSLYKPIVVDLTLLGMVNGIPGPKGLSGGDGPKTESNDVSVSKMAIPPHEPVSKKPVSKPKAVMKSSVPDTITKTQMPDLSPVTEPDGPVPVASIASLEPESYVAPSDAILTGNDSAVTPATGGSGNGSGTGHSEGTGGGGGGGGQETERYIRENFSYIMKIIEENIEYPQRARRMGWEGRVIVSFLIHEDGSASDIKIETSSGFEVLDTNVIQTVKEVAPFPIPPRKALLRVPVAYHLE